MADQVQQTTTGTRRHGRRSFYSVAPAARHDFWEADQRIYHPRAGTPWDGRWTIAVETPGPRPSPATRRLSFAL